jgi:hypothetical protein
MAAAATACHMQQHHRQQQLTVSSTRFTASHKSMAASTIGKWNRILISCSRKEE